MQRGRFVFGVEILGNADGVFVNPLAQRLVANALLLNAGQRRSVRILTLKLLFQQVFGDETPLGVGAARVLDGRIHVHAERIPNPANLDVLIERIVVAVLRQQPDVTLAIRHLVLARRVIRHVGVADVLDVPHQPVEYLGHLNVSLVIRRDDLARRPVLPLVVGDLLDVLRELVDGQARPRVDGLALHRPSGRQYVCRPLPVVVRRPRGEPQVVYLVLARLGVRRYRQRHAMAGLRQQVGFIRPTVCYR